MHMRQSFLMASVLMGSLLVLACSPGAAEPSAAREPLITWQTSRLTIRTSSGEHAFTVEIADDDARRERGLMYRMTMAPDAGMIFDYGAERQVAMWMKNTILSLDMVFIRSDGTVFSVSRNAVPYSEAIIRSGGPVQAVLELNAGTADRIALKPGDVVRHAMFGTAQ